MISAGLVATTVVPASAVAPSGGCASFFRAGTPPLEDTTPVSYLGAPKGAWSDEATTGVDPDYVLASTGGTTVGQTRTFEMTYDKGMLSFAPAQGDQHWFFSVNGVMLPPIVQSNVSLPGGVVSPGGSVSGSFTIDSAGPTEIVFEKMIFEATAGVRVVCSGQEDSTPTSNPHATPVATNVKTSFTAVGPTVASTSVKLAGAAPGNQALSNVGRAGDIINVETSVFSSTASGTLQLCEADGTSNCEGSGTVDGNGTGTLTIPAGATTGQRKLVATVGSETARADFRVLGQAAISTNVSAGGAGTNVTVTGSNFDPNVAVAVRGIVSQGPPPVNTADAPVNVTADANGGFTATFQVNDLDTTKIQAGQTHRIPAYATLGAVTAYADFTASGNSCSVGAPTQAVPNPSCSMVQTVELTVGAGELSMEQTAGEIDLGSVNLDGTAQTVTGELNDVTVQDYRGGTLGWTLNATFSGMTGDAADIDASALSIDPTCAPASNNDDVITTGTGGAFVDDVTALPLCSVASGATGTGSATTGGDTLATADLELALDANQAAGDYVGTLTLTLQ